MDFWCPLYRSVGILFPQTITPLLLLSPMSTQADIPSDLTNDTKALIFQVLDGIWNSMMLYALLHGEQPHFMSLYVCADQ